MVRILNEREYEAALDEQRRLVNASAVHGMTADTLAKLNASSQAIEEYRSSSAVTAPSGGVGHRSAGMSVESQARVLPPSQEQKQHDFRVALASSLISCSSRQPAWEIAAEFGNERVSAAMQANTHGSGGAWIAGEFSEQLVELLRPESIVRSMGVDVVPLEDGTMTMPKETGGPSGAYLGESEEADIESVETGDVKLIAKEMVCIVAASDKLIRSRSAMAAERIANSVIRGCGETEDLYFLRGTPGGAGPTGMRHLVLAANVLAANGTINLANVTNDLGRMENALLSRNVKFRKPAWVMSPRTLIYLSDTRDGNGNLAFPGLTLGEVPLLRRKPVYVTTQIPENLGSGSDESEIMLAEASHLIIGDAPNVALDSSNTAAYNDNGTVKAAFSRRQTLTRLVMENDFNTLHAGAIAVLTGVKWGA